MRGNILETNPKSSQYDKEHGKMTKDPTIAPEMNKKKIRACMLYVENRENCNCIVHEELINKVDTYWGKEEKQ